MQIVKKNVAITINNNYSFHFLVYLLSALAILSIHYQKVASSVVLNNSFILIKFNKIDSL